MNSARLTAAFVLFALHDPAALACGHCVEDKVAAVYDHAAITQAFASQHRVAFFAIDGPLAQTDGTRQKLERLAASAPGVDQGSVRVSVESAALAVAFDPRRTPFARLRKTLEGKFAAQKLTLQLLRVMEHVAPDKSAGRQQAK